MKKRPYRAIAVNDIDEQALANALESQDVTVGIDVAKEDFVAALKNEEGVVAPEEFISGTFPGSRKFLVTTPAGNWKIKVLLFLKDKLSPGTETSVSWYEPGCTDKFTYNLSEDPVTTDLFEKAGPDNPLSVEQVVTQGGDHVVEVFSDSTCLYLLRVEVTAAP